MASATNTTANTIRHVRCRLRLMQLVSRSLPPRRRGRWHATQTRIPAAQRVAWILSDTESNRVAQHLQRLVEGRTGTHGCIDSALIRPVIAVQIDGPAL